MNLKPEFEQRMQELLEKDYPAYCKVLDQRYLNSIRCNTLKISPDELKKLLEKEKKWKIKQPFENYPEIMVIEGKIIDNKDSRNKENNKEGNNKKQDTNNLNKQISSLKISKKDLALENSSEESCPKTNSEQYDFRAKRGKLGVAIGAVDRINTLEPGEIGRAIEHQLGYYYVQEISSMMPVLALNPSPDEAILDIAAAPGSKTTQIAAIMDNKGILIANEPNLGRIKILSANIQRCGVTNLIITQHDGANLCNRLQKAGFEFDKILLDAPCSGEGTLRTSPKTASMFSINMIKKLSAIQKNLLRSTLKILKKQGIIIYSTCTHAPEENEEVIDEILKQNPDIKLEKVNLPLKTRQGITQWKDKKYSEQLKLCARIYPQDNNTEGFFVAKLRRVG